MNLKKRYELIKHHALKEEDVTSEGERWEGMMVHGEVIHGSKNGRKMRFPTANFKISEEAYNMISLRPYKERWANADDFILVADVKIEGDTKDYQGILIVEYMYDWHSLRTSLAKGYNPQDNVSKDYSYADGYIAVRELENGKYEIADGNHRYKVLMELHGEDEVIEVKTNWGEKISIRLGDIQSHTHRHFGENQISVHIFDFSGDIYGKEISVFPKKRVCKEVMDNLHKIREELN